MDAALVKDTDYSLSEEEYEYWSERLNDANERHTRMSSDCEIMKRVQENVISIHDCLYDLSLDGHSEFTKSRISIARYMADELSMIVNSLKVLKDDVELESKRDLEIEVLKNPTSESYISDPDELNRRIAEIKERYLDGLKDIYPF